MDIVINKIKILSFKKIKNQNTPPKIDIKEKKIKSDFVRTVAE